MVSDPHLVDQADVIVTGRVARVAPVGWRPVATSYRVRIDRLLKGTVPSDSLEVRVPGAEPGGPLRGPFLVVFGAPRFEPGEEVLLFLRRQLGREAEARQARKVRHAERFARWIERRVVGLTPVADYFLEEISEPGEIRLPLERFKLFQVSGVRMRWFDFDGGTAVEWRRGSQAQPGLSTAEIETTLAQAIAAWNGVSRARVAYRAGLQTSSTGGLTFSDGINSILFEDPNGHSAFGGTFSCSTGGVLALGGPWIAVTQTYQGETFWRIVEADVVTNQGLGCFFERSVDRLAAAAELFGHELGHTLGIDHSSEGGSEPSAQLRDAIMYFLIKDDGRGAQLNADDWAAVRRLYPDLTGIFSDGFESGDLSRWSVVVD